MGPSNQSVCFPSLCMPGHSRSCLLYSPAPLTLILGISEEGEFATLLRTSCSTQKLSEAILPGLLPDALHIPCLHLSRPRERAYGQGCWGYWGKAVLRKAMVGGDRRVLGELGTCPYRKSEKNPDDWVPASP